MIRCKWEPGVIYDQGNSSACTGFAWATALRTKWGDDTDDPKDLYAVGFKRQYEKSDGFGQLPLTASSVSDALIEAGYIKGVDYLTIDRVVSEVAVAREVIKELQDGPLLLSTEWYRGFNDKTGLQMEPTGGQLGRHLTAVLDACFVRGLVIQNSHGPRWGDQGRKFLKWRTLISLMRSDRAHLIKINF